MTDPDVLRLSWDCPLCGWPMRLEAGIATDGDVAHLKQVGNYLVEQHTRVEAQQLDTAIDVTFGQTYERSYRGVRPPL